MEADFLGGRNNVTSSCRSLQSYHKDFIQHSVRIQIRHPFSVVRAVDTGLDLGNVLVGDSLKVMARVKIVLRKIVAVFNDLDLDKGPESDLAADTRSSKTRRRVEGITVAISDLELRREESSLIFIVIVSVEKLVKSNHKKKNDGSSVEVGFVLDSKAHDNQEDTLDEVLDDNRAGNKEGKEESKKSNHRGR